MRLTIFSVIFTLTTLYTSAQTLLQNTTVIRFVYNDSVGNSYTLTSNKDGDRFIEKRGASAFSTCICTKLKDGNLIRLIPMQNGLGIITLLDESQDKLLKHNFMSWDGKLKKPEAEVFQKIKSDKKNKVGAFDFFLSSDTTKILMVARKSNDPLEKDRSLAFYCYDNNFNLIYEKKTYTYKPFKHGDAMALNFYINNNADIVYYVEYTVEKKSGFIDHKEDWLFSISSALNKIDSVKLSPAGGWLVSFTAKMEKEKMKIYGIYIIEDKGQGFYYAEFDLKSNNLLSQITSDFTPEMFITDGAVQVNSNGFPYLGSIIIFQNIIPAPDNTFKVILFSYNISMNTLSHGSLSGTTIVNTNRPRTDTIQLNTEGKVITISTVFQ